jgi:hypothetical protein
MYEKSVSRYKILCEVQIEWIIQLWHSNWSDKKTYGLLL